MNLSPLLFLSYNQNMQSRACKPRFWLMVPAMALFVLGCGAPTPASSPVPQAAATSTMQPSTAGTPAAPPTPMNENSYSGGLLRALDSADRAMGDARTASSLSAARARAEVVVNVLVGMFGRWYGDGDGDGRIDDPGDGLGVLPGERVPQPAPDTRAAVMPTGWAIATYDDGGDQAKTVVRLLIGDVDLWKNSPRDGYNQVELALSAGTTSGSAIAKLPGSVPRALAWARFILTRTQSLDDARSAAAQGAKETNSALQSAHTIP